MACFAAIDGDEETIANYRVITTGEMKDATENEMFLGGKLACSIDSEKKLDLGGVAEMIATEKVTTTGEKKDVTEMESVQGGKKLAERDIADEKELDLGGVGAVKELPTEKVLARISTRIRV